MFTPASIASRLPRRHMLALPLVALLPACASEPTFAPAPPPLSKSHVLVYFYRPSSITMSGVLANIDLNGKRIVNLGEDQYTWFHANAGRNELKQHWSNSSPATAHSMITIWEPGQLYFYRVEAFVDGGNTRTRLVGVPKDEALAEIGPTRYLAPTTMEQPAPTPR